MLLAEASGALRACLGNVRLSCSPRKHCASARVAFDRITGRAGVEDLLDALFGRFCLGK